MAAQTKKTAKPRPTKPKQHQTFWGELKAFIHRPAVIKLFKLVLLVIAADAVLLSFFFRTVLRDYAYLEIFPHELVFPVVLHTCTAIFIALSVYWVRWLKTYLGKITAAILLALLLVGYDTNMQAVNGLIRAFMPGLSASDPLPVVSIIYLVILYALAVLLGALAERFVARTKKLNNRDSVLGLCILSLYLFIVPAYSVLRMLPTLMREADVQAPTFSRPAGAKVPADKPDIYYIVLDRYTNQTVLKNQFNYDNSSFINYLGNQGFYVNGDASGNYPYTTMSISSTLNAQYTNKLVAPFKSSSVQSRTLYHNLIWQSPVIKALKGSGYAYYEIGSTYGASYDAPLADRKYINDHTLTIFGHSKVLRGIEALQFMQSPYYRIAQLSSSLKWWPASVQDQDRISDVRQQLNDLDTIASQEKPGGRFIFAHILVPHDPFDFNADGSINPYNGTDSVGEPIKQKYVNQITFINSQISEVINRIQKNSNGQAVIILNADEGAYPEPMTSTFKSPGATNASEEGVLLGQNMQNWSDDWLHMKFGVLQAVHIPRATTDDLSNISSVNLFRVILNRYAGYSLPYLPDCHYALTDGSQYEYDYTDVTQHFTDNPSPVCKTLISQPAKK